MPLTKITSSEIQTGAVTADKIANNVTLGGPKITTVNVANSAYTVLDDTAVNIGGGYIVITGSGFESGAQVIIDTTTATSVAYVNNTTLRAEVPSKSAASYNLYVVNSDGGTAIRVNGLTYSANPTWVTASPLDNWSVDVAANVAFSATGATSYSNTTALPAGTQLLSNGYFYGTVTGISVETQYTFTVRATDAENQDADKSFSVTVTVGPPQGYIYVWGQNSEGGLGLNDINNKSSPTQLGSSSNWVSIGSTASNFFGIKSDGTLWGSGSNSYGRLGLNDQIARSSPVQIGSSTNWKTIDREFYVNFAAIKTDGTLWSWGYNNKGQLGLNDTVSRSSPVQVGTNTNWSLITSGGYSDMTAIKTDGTLWSWGYNEVYGHLGHNDKVNKSSPTQVGSSTNWSSVSMNNSKIATIKTDGTLWLWGRNDQGQLGLNTTYNSRSSPTQVGTNTNWSLVSVGSIAMAAIKTDKSLWMWGTNTNIVIDPTQSSSYNKSSPIQIGSDSWNDVSLSNFATFAIKSDGTLWTWGVGTNGILGLNSISSTVSRTQIGSSTKWSKIVAAANITIGKLLP